MLGYLEYLNLPSKVAIVIVLVLVVMNLVGEILEFKGKVVPEFVKMRKFFSRKKAEREDTAQTLKAVKQLLGDVNAHYSEDNITKRNNWMNWVNCRADIYDQSIADISSSLADVTRALNDNTKMTEELFVQNSRDRIIDFATKVSDDSVMVSREEFNRIFKVYRKYEAFLEERGLTNGEIDVVYRIIAESYENHMKNHSFIEDVRGY